MATHLEDQILNRPLVEPTSSRRRGRPRNSWRRNTENAWPETEEAGGTSSFTYTPKWKRREIISDQIRSDVNRKLFNLPVDILDVSMCSLPSSMVDFARSDFFTKGALKFYHFLMNSTTAGAYTHVKKKLKHRNFIK